MKNVFIDSNIWLSLYHFSNNDLEQFSKLKNYINKGIKLYVTSQVNQEILRNREKKLKDALKDFEVKSITYPAFCKGYDEFKDIKNKNDMLMIEFKKWKVKISNDIKMKNLPADKVIKDIFSEIEIIDSNLFVAKANQRCLLGNPPGKSNSYGDAINWECLLESIPKNENLYFISEDNDYASVLFNDDFNYFLCHEWEVNKGSKIYFYKSLPSFLSQHVEEIKLHTEIEKDEYIDRLSKSISYYETHRIISVLSKYPGWTQPQYERLAEIALSNNQVSWILGDSDVFEFYFRLLENIEITNASESVQILNENIRNISQEMVNDSEREFESEFYDAIEEYHKH